MEWLSKCINDFYSSPCSNNAPATALPPIVTEPLPSVIPVSCVGCTKPCISHPLVPSHLNIDQSRPLNNTVPPYAVHLIILTGKTDWAAHIEDEGLAAALIKAIDERKRQGTDQRSERNRYFALGSMKKDVKQRIVVTNASLPSQYSTKRGASDVLLMPDNVVISNVTARQAHALLDFVFGKPSHLFETFPMETHTLILICGHGNKDRRCGTIGPMLQRALQQALHEANDHQAQVALVSHLGGHAFAGNVVVYTYQGQRAIWYGRVTPCHCKEIVQQTIQNDYVLQDLVRGIFEVDGIKEKTSCRSSQLDW
ncbi:Sucrase/ferredoxin-like-domain-containing protein [Radiomyces spectabilis]|uniref:Sucrase/ferredoxin-like-domain-containing protein n=1 Tax=Radiomyces spectabilis TaxID=64574 RepID=UPI002220702D|nr:Sucrase/ferredoxin-like-domain-containing protein [Radiomyces spectabilis]KAI8388653.1 Sucrase/ferredoxin-like-domain-containing protein [Radiomyces spectabilis]